MTDNDKKRKKLINRAIELDQELSFIENDLHNIVSEIQDLKPTKKELKMGEKKEGKKSYRVNIKLPEDMNPFKLKRKFNLYNNPKKYKY